MKRILIVEDENYIRDELEILLKKAAYEVSKIIDFQNTSEEVLAFKGDLILLDLNLPGESGFEICRKVKERGSIPVLVLTSRNRIEDEVDMLKIGADDYLTKPFRKERLLARIENLLKRYPRSDLLLEQDYFTLDKNTYTLYTNRTSVVLPPNQGKMLEIFICNENHTITKEEFFIHLWNTTEYIDENALHVNISRLKHWLKKLDLPYQIQSVRGKGYRMIKGGKDEQ